MELINISLTNTILIGIFSVIVLIYLWLKRALSYWERRGVPHVKASSIIFGNLNTVLYDKKEHVFQMHKNIYNQFVNESYCGFYEFHYPILMIRDPQLIHMVMVEKFNSFHSPKIAVNSAADELLSHNPFVLTGARWKDTKSMLSIGLTQNKLRALDDILNTVSQDMCNYIDNNPDDIELYRFASSCTSEVVANFGWGMRSNGFSKTSPVKEMFDLIQFSSGLSFTLMLLHPFLSRLLNIRFFSKPMTNFLKDITQQMADTMEQNKSNQHTFLQNLLNAREKYRNSGKDMTLSEMAGHMSTFFLDGYETSARVISLILYSLALHPEIQQKVKEEVLSLDENFTVESVSKLQYMEMFISEVFRCYPLLPSIGRICTENCKLGDLEVQKGEYVILPIYPIHKDSNYYPDPEVFNPENFSEENKSNRQKFTFFNFGAGPRICLGMRYATAVIKLLLCYILRNYDIVPPKNHTLKPLTPSPESLVFFIPKDPMYVSFKKTKI